MPALEQDTKNDVGDDRDGAIGVRGSPVSSDIFIHGWEILPKCPSLLGKKNGGIGRFSLKKLGNWKVFP